MSTVRGTRTYDKDDALGGDNILIKAIFDPVLTSLSLLSSGCSCDGNVENINPLNPELNPVCYLLALLGAHHFLHVSRIRVKLLTFRLLMSYIYMEHPFLMFLDHTQQRSTVGRTPLYE